MKMIQKLASKSGFISADQPMQVSFMRGIIQIVVVFFSSMIIHLYLQHIHYPSISSPPSFGAIKDLVDPILLVVIYYGGWVFAITWLTSILLKFSRVIQFFVYIFASACMGFSQTLLSFSNYGVLRLFKGMLTYLILFGITYVLLITTYLIWKGIKKCLL